MRSFDDLMGSFWPCVVFAVLSSLVLSFDCAAQAEQDRTAAEEVQQFTELMREADALFEAKRYDQALVKYEALAKQNHPDAMVRVAMMKMGGWGVDKDQVTAVALFRRLIDMGESNEHYRLWPAYQRGLGLSPDETEFAQHYHTQAQAGDPAAMYQYAMMLLLAC